MAGAAGGASSWLWGKATETAEAVRRAVPHSAMDLTLALAPTLTLPLTLTPHPNPNPNL